MNFEVKDYIVFAERQLTSQRFQHSLGVMQVMDELAAIYDLDKTAAITAGILHDIAKEFTPDDLMKLASENHIVLCTEYDKIPLFLHGPIGACYIAQKLGLRESTILEAISRHSYFGEGAALSATFCWCLRLADLLEPSRNWEEMKRQIKPFVYAGELGEAAYRLMKWIIPFHESMALPVHPNMHRVFNDLSILKREEILCEANCLPV